MKADTVSSLVGREILRSAMARNQTSLTDALKEFSTGRHADVGKVLGGRVGGVLDMRNIVGSLILIGRGERPVQWLGELLAGRDRSVAGPTASAAGLTFLGPRYPREFGLPAEVSL